jgi:serine/threonine-protein kinase
MIGTKLAHYEITSHLGTGGMGEVYQATDMKLGRSVAVKVLLEAVAQDSERIARFEREAKLLASLNHPNIATLYGMEVSGGKHFLVMELVEGATLAERIKRNPIPVEEAVRIARQIVEALEAAHEKGIVHRDLKPANVKITPDDKVKVLDFGLAKAMENAPVNATLSNSPTLSFGATQVGVILGTAAYMSPEQAKGFVADPRSDVFSFGCVLYEMLSGRQAFQGETVSEIIAAVLIREPDPSALPSDLNPRMLELLRHCLEKNPKRRLQAVGDLRLELETIAAAPRAVASRQAAAKPQPLWRRAIPVLVTAIVFSVIAGVTAWNTRKPDPVNIVRLPLVLPEGQQLLTFSHPLAISPDGTRMVYVANNQLFLRTMGEWEARPIAGTPGGPGSIGEPFFSPNSQWVGFYSREDSAIKKVAVTGGAAVLICKTDTVSGATWTGDQIWFARLRDKGIMRVSENGGEPVEIVPRKMPSETMQRPQLLNGGRSLLYTVAIEGGGDDRWDTAQIVVQSLPAGDRNVVIRGGTDARYLPTGHLVYALGGTVFAILFDEKTGKTQGGSVPILEAVMYSKGTNTGASHFDVSVKGSLAYVPGNGSASATPQRTLAQLDRTGKAQPLPLPPQNYLHPRVSPDGKQLAFGTDDGREAGIWIYDLKGNGPPRKLTVGGRNLDPVWTTDSLSITFRSVRDGASGLFQQRADGVGSAERLTKVDSGRTQVPESWSGKTLLYRQMGLGTSIELWTLSLDGEKKTAPLLQASSTSVLTEAVFSPDGHWFAYRSNELGRSQIFVQPFPPIGTKYQVSTEDSGGGGFDPLWSPEGKELFYVSAVSARMMAIEVRTTPSFTFGKPTPIPVEGLAFSTDRRNYDITHDGKQFVAVLEQAGSQADSGGRPARQQINVVLNWFEELKQRVPSR